MLLLDLVENAAEECKGLEHVRLVDTGQHPRLAARLAPLGEAKREVEQALGGLARDHHGLARILMGDDALAHRGEQAFGELADHDEIDAALVGADDRARHARNQPRRAHAGIEIEDEAQLDLRRDLGIVGVAHRRQAAGAEQDRVGLLAQFDRGIRHRLAGGEIIVGAGGRLGEAEAQAGLRLDLAQHLERGRHDFGTDAVTGEHGNVEGVVCGHLRGLKEGTSQVVIARSEATKQSRLSLRRDFWIASLRSQ